MSIIHSTEDILKNLRKRLGEEVEEKLDEDQATYRPQRQIQDHIFVPKTVMEKRLEKENPLYLAFVDTVPKQIVWNPNKHTQQVQDEDIDQEILEVYDIDDLDVSILGPTFELDDLNDDGDNDDAILGPDVVIEIIWSLLFGNLIFQKIIYWTNVKLKQVKEKPKANRKSN
ncbi:hypothetical protein FQA39_LY05809 [Lamprigera yunnana]|nr:hypothetical protein FQA39_LY05809 [Lamprigera yunnana]